MDNNTRFLNVFCQALEVSNVVAKDATADNLATWDSLRHMNLIAALEDEFDIELEPEDVIEITSYQTCVEALKKYGVEL